MTDQINVEVDADTQKAIRALNDLISKLGDVNRSGPEAAKAIDAVERSATKIVGALQNGTKSLRQQAQAIRDLQSAAKGLNATGLGGAGGSITKNLNNALASDAQKKVAQDAAAAQQKALDQQNAAYQSYSKNVLATARKQASEEQRLAYQTYAQNMPAALKQTQDAIYKTYAANTRATQSIQNQKIATQGLANQRYALYDVATTWGVISAATLGASAAVVKVGIDYQKNFAQVARTVGGTQQSLAALKSSLIDLSTTVPVSFQDLTAIASLGGQLGVASSGIGQFTDVVAKLTATTNLSAEAAGTALGRFEALLGTTPNQFNNVASAILKVGVNSVATETQIVNTATQISSMGKLAGLTADQVVGLSGALASVGAAPELARGTVTRVFTNMATAVQSGGTALQGFAQISGVSAEQFKSTWGTPQFAATFQDFLKGIGSQGQSAISTLNGLGISSVRDVPLLLRLAGAGKVVQNAFADAATGFADGTELNRQYAITLDTVAAKLTILGNTLKGILAGPGSAALGPIAGFLDVVQNLAKSLLDLANTGVGQVLGVILVAVTALVGAFIALRAAQALTTASALAFVTAQDALEGSLLKSAGGVGGMIKQMAILTVGTERATAAQKAYADSVAAGSGKFAAFGAGAKGAATAIGGLSSALKGIGVFAAISLAIGALTAFSHAQQEAKAHVDDLTTSLDAQTGAITENTRAKVHQNLVDSGAIKTAQELGVSTKLVTDAALGNAGAVAQLQAAYQKYATAAAAPINYDLNFTKEVEEQQKAIDSADQISGQYRKILNAVGFESKSVAESQKVYAEQVEAGVAASEDGGAAAQDLVGDLQDLLSSEYDLVGGTVDVQNAMYALGSSIAENGNSFDAFSVGGRANLEALQGVISAMATASGGDAAVLATNLEGLMQSLASYGVDTVGQLAYVRNAIAALVGQSGGGGLAFVKDAADRAGNALSQGFGAGAAKIKKTGGAANQAAKEVKTLTDYVSDLSSVFKSAFDIRFGLQQSVDKVSKAWQDMTDSADEARQAVIDATQAISDSDATIAGLNASNNTLTYQLGIATQYGDSLRAVEITAELAKNSADLADEQKARAKSQKDLTKAQAAAIPSLTGNTEGAIDQRDAVLGLVQAYQDQVAALANQGLSQQEVTRRTAELKQQFINQLVQMGYNRAEVEKYADSFDDLTAAIARVPRNITVSANTDPAQRAIDEFLAKNANKSVAIGAGGGGGSFTVPSVNTANLNATNTNTTAFHSASTNLDRVVVVPVSGGKIAAFPVSTGGVIPQRLARGGMAGIDWSPQGTDTIPAMLTPGEFVMNRAAVQSMGLPFMNALNNQQTPKYLSSGGSVNGGGSASGITLVEILPTQLAQLAQMVSSRLSIDGKVVAEATNNNNVASARRGSN